MPSALRNSTSINQSAAPPAVDIDGRKKVLQIEGLTTHFFLEEGVLEAVRGVDLTLYEGEMIALVGESGCGKSVTALSILGLTKESRASVVAGCAWYFDADGAACNLASLGDSALSRIRGKEIAMIFQDPLTSLNPVLSIGEQITEVMRRHIRISGNEARNRAVELLSEVGIADPSGKLSSYPHEFSGGMRQRVMIAMALALNPRLLIADEPTTALDVTIQAQILELLSRLREKFKTSILLITHDLGVVAQTCSRVNVMYAGKIVESCSTEAFFSDPRHPYSRGLLASLPRLDEARRSLEPIKGQPPDLIGIADGCPFAPRCAKVMDVCRVKYPVRHEDGEHSTDCWLYDKPSNHR
ncbi:MAG: ABC transporter ATP-binding protein [bacterium]|jgi:oligopeptide/dipeptide ABC transporter ATP-binding protein